MDVEGSPAMPNNNILRRLETQDAEQLVFYNALETQDAEKLVFYDVVDAWDEGKLVF